MSALVVLYSVIQEIVVLLIITLAIHAFLANNCGSSLTERMPALRSGR